MASIECSGRFVATVDDEDAERISRHAWQVKIDGKSRKPYAYRSVWRDGKPRVMWMAREVMGMEIGARLEVDHRDNNATLDNRKRNLRVATRSQNNCNRGTPKNNTSGIKGVCRDGGMWKAQIRHQKVYYYLGSFPTKEEAGAAYAEAANRLHGEFARV